MVKRNNETTNELNKNESRSLILYGFIKWHFIVLLCFCDFRRFIEIKLNKISREAVAAKMSGHNLSVDGELRYIIQWFNEWSDLQREDFLPILVEYLTKDGPAHYMNGIVNSLAAATCEDKPMSLFQCRVSF